MTTLEQLVVLKESSCCVLGNAENGVQWGMLTTDYLLYTLCVSNRYKHIICVNIDRKMSDLLKIEIKSEKFRKNVSNGEPESFSLLNNSDFFSDGLFDLSLVYEAIKSKFTTSHRTSFALFIYSLSEIILNVGIARAIFFMKRLDGLLSPASMIGNDPTSAAAPATCLVYVIHESLHSPHDLARLQGAVTAVVRVVPNRGTLSPEVAAEIHTIRKSTNTGKVVECTELAVFRDGFLCPLTNKSSSGAVATGDSSNFEESDRHPPTDNLLEKLLNDDNKGPLKANTEPTGLMAPRLITFDSTDPEFDEDSDPDADLDL
jgi:hypothetical protein